MSVLEKVKCKNCWIKNFRPDLLHMIKGEKKNANRKM